MFRLPASGTYTAIITSWAPGETGGYRLVLSDPDQRPLTIGRAPSAAEPAGSGTARPHSVRGSVVDTQGRPIAGARVTLQPALTLGQVNVTTDASGEYAAESLPDVPHQARAWAMLDYGGQSICMRLGLESDSDYNSFSAANGAVRNFRMQLTGAIGDMQSAVDGHFGGVVSFLGSHNVAASGEQVELTFVPTGPLIDGSTAEPFTRLVTGRDGDLVKGIPVGPYRLSAQVIGTDGSRVPLDLGRTWTGELAPSLDIDWTGSSTCTLNSGFDWVEVHSRYSR